MSNGEFGNQGWRMGWRAPHEVGCAFKDDAETIAEYLRPAEPETDAKREAERVARREAKREARKAAKREARKAEREARKGARHAEVS